MHSARFANLYEIIYMYMFMIIFMYEVLSNSYIQQIRRFILCNFSSLKKHTYKLWSTLIADDKTSFPIINREVLCSRTAQRKNKLAKLGDVIASLLKLSFWSVWSIFFYISFFPYFSSVAWLVQADELKRPMNQNCGLHNPQTWWKIETNLC